MKYTDKERLTAMFTCPNCAGHIYSYSEYRVHGEPLRRCASGFVCNFAWPADDDSGHLILAPKWPPKPTAEWLAEHSVRIKESTPRIPKSGETVATWQLATQQDGAYTEACKLNMDNGSLFMNDKYDGLRWILEALPMPPKPTEAWLKANNVRLKEQLPRESKGGELIANWLHFLDAKSGSPYDNVYKNSGPNGGCWGGSDPFQRKRYILEELPPNPHQRFLDAVKAGKNVWCKQAGLEREGLLCCINTCYPNSMEDTILRVDSNPEQWLLVEGEDIPMRPTQAYLDKYGFKLKDCCRPLVKGDWYHGWHDETAPINDFAPDTWTWNDPSDVLWKGYRWILEPKVDTQQEFKAGIERKLEKLKVETEYGIQRIRRALDNLR